MSGNFNLMPNNGFGGVASISGNLFVMSNNAVGGDLGVNDNITLGYGLPPGAITTGSRGKVQKSIQGYSGVSVVIAGGPGTAPACFLAGTQVTMADGTTKNIEDVKVGEKVISYDTQNKVTAISEVTKTFVHTGEQMTGDYYLVITTQKGSVMKVTINHPIYTNGVWKEAGSLQVDDPLLNQENQTDKIVSIEKVYEKPQTYNLEVANYHDYYAEGILVHNKPSTIYPGNVYLAGGLNTSTAAGGDVYIYGGSGNSGASLGNIYLANNGSASQGKVGVGVYNSNSAPLSLLDVAGFVPGKALVSLNETGDQALFTASASGVTKFIIDHSGNVGIGTNSPLATLDVRGSSGTTPVASFSGATSFAGLVVDQSGAGDVFTASSSGFPLFTVQNAGTLVILAPLTTRQAHVPLKQPVQAWLFAEQTLTPLTQTGGMS